MAGLKPTGAKSPDVEASGVARAPWEGVPMIMTPSWANELGVLPLTARLLALRLPDPSLAAARAFLDPTLGDLHPHDRLPAIEPALERLIRAVRGRERIVVHGDYDTDGVTATAVLVRILRALGAEVEYHVPCRLEEGYGIAASFVDGAKARGVGLVVTVDCGISEHEPIAALQAAGIDVIVTDHHEPGDQALPPALAVIDPKRADSAYPFRELTGVGVAWKVGLALCQAIIGSPKVGPDLQGVLLQTLAYVALGTIADVAPLVDENRTLVHYGLRSLARAGQETEMAGLEELKRISRVKAVVPTVRDVSFGLSPRINAAGRMGDAELALRLLLEDHPLRAAELAAELDRHNSQRQTLCQRQRLAAEAQVLAMGDLAGHGALVVAETGWHEGVSGIVAGRLAETYNRPAIVIALPEDGGPGKGSARGVPGVNLYAALAASRERFLRFGGHEQAAGFSIEADQVDGLRREVDAACLAQLRHVPPPPPPRPEAVVALADVADPRQAREIARLAPFGEGNPAPLLGVPAIRACQPKAMGREEKHFRFTAAAEGASLPAVVFNDTAPLRRMDDEGILDWDLVATLEINGYWSTPRPELRVAAMTPAARPSVS